MKSVNQYVMKDSGVQWIGQVPKHWEVCHLKRVVTINNGSDYKHCQVEPCIYPVIGSGGIFTYASSYIYDGEVLLLGRKGTIDKPMYYNGKFWTVDTMFYAVSNGNAICKYLYYHSMLIPFARFSTSTALPSMTQTDLKNNLICLPPLSEQRAIADWLDAKCADIDAAIELQQRMIDKLKAYKTAVIHQAVTKGLDKNANLKDSGVQWIGEVPEHWEVCKIKNIGLFYSGLVNKRGDDFNVEETDKFAYYIPFTNIFNNVEIDVTQLRKVKVNPVEAQNEAKENDIFFLMSSEDTEGIGKTAVLRELIAEYKPLYLNSFCKGLRITSNEVDAIFLNYFMSSDAGNTYCRLQANGFIRINLRLTKLVDCPVLLPPLAEQRAIADWLDAKCADIDATIALKEQKQEKLKAYKKTIIFEYVTGKKQVANINKQL